MKVIAVLRDPNSPELEAELRAVGVTGPMARH
jgi:hypothetical protein